MPKLKTKKAIAKRFKLTKKGKVKSSMACRRHLLTGKSRKRKRSLSRRSILGKAQAKRVKTMLPYG